MKPRILLCACLLLSPLWAADTRPGAGMPPPPPLDSAACAAKAAGATVQITSPDGRSIKATCVLVALPDRPAGPPPAEPRAQ